MRDSWSLTHKPAVVAALALAVLAALPGPAGAQDAACRRTVTAHVVALDQILKLNRLGSEIPGGMMYALARDVFPAGTPVDQQTDANSCRWKMAQCQAGKVMLRYDKRPRPLVLRVNEGDCLQIELTNLLGAQECFDSSGNPATCGGSNVALEQPSTPWASIHVQGMPWVNGPQDDGSFVSSLGTDPPQVNSLAASNQSPAASKSYTLFAEHEGSYLLYSTADDWTPAPGLPAQADGGALADGLFGAVNIQPSGFSLGIGPDKDYPAEWYRSQVTEQDLCLASESPDINRGGRCEWADSSRLPVINYQARYPAGHPHAGLPILNMLCTAASPNACDANELVYSDLTAVITGPNAGRFPNFPIQDLPPDLRPIYASPDRLQPYREFTIIYHESFQVAQAFSPIFSSSGNGPLQAAQDNFGINYGMGALSPELLSNRLGVGPAAKCTDCKFEEFFLSSWALGDPAMPVDKSASSCLGSNDQPIAGCQATAALYPDDPSNVYHSYMSDHTKFRILHAGPDLHHLHHQHAHQWLGTPNSPNGDYLDSQSIGPGSSFTLEMVYNGSGNLNQTVGDSIFHCHFYPHFGSGMWSLWRVHDVLERGTEMEPCGAGDKYQCPGKKSRALPDGEIARGTPIPAVVPMPTLPMAPVPARVQLQSFCSNDLTKSCSDDGDCGRGNTCQQSYCVVQTDATGQEGPCVSAIQASSTSWEQEKKFRNPGYPFFIPGIAGARAPHPPLDFAHACSKSGKVCTPGTPTGLGTPESCDAGETCDPMDGGLPRHLIVRGGEVTYPNPDGGDYQAKFELTPSDFSKFIKKATAVHLPEEGAWVEKVAMATHAQRFHDTQLPDGRTTGICSDNKAPCSGQGLAEKQQCENPAKATCDTAGRINFVLNGLPPESGAPYAEPCIQFRRQGGAPENMLSRRFLAVDIQLDAIFNKSGWHFPQQRILSLWGDAQALIDREKPPEPFFIRTNSEDCMEYVYANLVPNVYELDDFEVRTPTDILGQHIHLVKFDVTSSDGSGNGWNYEDGNFAPNEVTERIHALNEGGGLVPPPGGGSAPPDKDLEPKFIRFFGPGPGGAWYGSQATVQRWYADPLFNNQGFCSTDLSVSCTLEETKFGISRCPNAGVCVSSAGVCSDKPGARCTDDDRHLCASPQTAECNTIYDRTLRTVFTHDHFGPSTHQQAGLYAGVIVEPKGSIWRDNQTGEVFGGYRPSVGANDEGRTAVGYEGTRVRDGGPTTWQAVIETPDKNDSYREFLLEIQDSTLTYQPFAVRALNADDKEQFTDGSYQKHCANREPWEPCGYCSYNGVCVDPSTGRPSRRMTTCSLPSPALRGGSGGGVGTGCTGGDVCRLISGYLTACTPEDLGSCNAGVDSVPPSCNFVTGVPSTSWVAGNASTSPIGLPIDATGVEAITFDGATNNFSFNYRNEPLYARTTDPWSGNVLAGNTGDLAYAYSSDPKLKRPNPRGAVCSNNLSLACETNGDCPSTGLQDPCDWAGFCSDNSALCTPANRSLCGNPQTATCKGTCDPRQDGTGCDTSFPYPDRPLIPGVPVEPGDPFTPLMRAYAGDDIQVRPLIGAHINPHNYTMNGLKWLLEPSFVDSGWRNSEVMGISEHFELLTRVAKPFAPAASGRKPWEDYLYQPGFAIIEQASGNWGLLRAFDTKRDDLSPLPQNKPPASAPASSIAVCPQGAPSRTYEVVAANASLVYNQAEAILVNVQIPLNNPNGMVFARKGDSNLKCTGSGTTLACTYQGTPQPLVLRAAAGDCIKVTLTNGLDPSKLATGTPSGQSKAKSNTSAEVALHPQLLTYDVRKSDGTNAGFNPVQTAARGASVPYTWYAGSVDTSKGSPAYIPIEFGASNLLPPDPINHAINGLFAGLIVEPEGATWVEGNPLSGSKASTEAVVTYLKPDGKTKQQFREFVMFTQDGLPKSLSADLVNFRTELLNTGAGPVRFCDSSCADATDFSCLYAVGDQASGATAYCKYQESGADVCKPCTEFYATNKIPFPETPTFQACAGEQVRIRMLHPGGTNTDQVMEIYGHNFSEAPYMTPFDSIAEGERNCKAPITHTNLYASQVQGTRNLCGSLDWLTALPPTMGELRAGLWDASLNEWRGSRMGHGPSNHFDALIGQAGGPFAVAGDYLYRSYPSMHFNFGIWGIFRVLDRQAQQCLPPAPDPAKKEFTPEGQPVLPELAPPSTAGAAGER